MFLPVYGQICHTVREGQFKMIGAGDSLVSLNLLTSEMQPFPQLFHLDNAECNLSHFFLHVCYYTSMSVLFNLSIYRLNYKSSSIYHSFSNVHYFACTDLLDFITLCAW